MNDVQKMIKKATTADGKPKPNLTEEQAKALKTMKKRYDEYEKQK